MAMAGILALVFAAGCAGGLVNTLLTEELHLPKFDKEQEKAIKTSKPLAPKRTSNAAKRKKTYKRSAGK